MQVALDVVLNIADATAAQGAKRIAGGGTVGADLADLAAGQDRSSAWPTRLNWLAVETADRCRTTDDLGAGQIDAELLGDIAIHLGDADFQHHLLAGGDARSC